jgi:fucose 4-O-acetylase-like acetyltransferase
MSTSERITWIDSMKAFSILAVVLNHTHITPDIKDAAYLVCLPAFFFVAGIFTHTQLRPSDFFKRQTLRLLIPYLVFGLLSWVAWCVIGRNYGTDAETALAWWEPLGAMLCGQVEGMIHNPPLWFLCCMMCLEWIHYAVFRIPRTAIRWIVILTLGAIGCLGAYFGIHGLWEIVPALIMLPLYTLGQESKEWLKRLNATPTGTIVLMLLVSLVGVTIGYLFNRDVRIAEGVIGNPLLFYITELSVVGLWLSVSLLIHRIGKHIRLLPYIGQNTMLVLCAHVPVFGIIKGAALLCHTSLSWFETTPGCLTLWLGTFLLLLPVAYLINRFCPILVGKH